MKGLGVFLISNCLKLGIEFFPRRSGIFYTFFFTINPALIDTLIGAIYRTNAYDTNDVPASRHRRLRKSVKCLKSILIIVTNPTGRIRT